MESVLHARRTDPRVGAWLETARAPDAAGRAQLREIQRDYERNAKVPAKLAAAIARITSIGHGIWADAKMTEDFAAFAPTLKEIVKLRREEAAALAAGGDLYDALLNDYEPGMTGARDRGRCSTNCAPASSTCASASSGSDAEVPGIDREFTEAGQLALSRELALAFGYDMVHGRIDKAVHPFSSGSGLDVRITTRTNPRDPFNCFYSTIHEVGHAAYEQSIDRAFLLTPIGRGCSMGVHESQSRIYENQLGRSRAFTSFLYNRMIATFDDFGVPDAGTFYRIVNRVQPGYIRTEADEVHYNLHILMRFDLERALIEGLLEVDDLPEAWNARFEADFGVAVDKPSHGVLQDVHWSAGLFGYFPTYTLGNVYAGCLTRRCGSRSPTSTRNSRKATRQWRRAGCARRSSAKARCASPARRSACDGGGTHRGAAAGLSRGEVRRALRGLRERGNRLPPHAGACTDRSEGAVCPLALPRGYLRLDGSATAALPVEAVEGRAVLDKLGQQIGRRPERRILVARGSEGLADHEETGEVGPFHRPSLPAREGEAVDHGNVDVRGSLRDALLDEASRPR
jgi:carboxypeptidase Taq